MKKRMHRGISLYPGLGRSAGENLARLEQAADLGFTDLFLSFHIPETDEGAFAQQVAPLLARAGSSRPSPYQERHSPLAAGP